MNSKLTILPHITVLSYFPLKENLNMRLLNHQENRFIFEKFQFIKENQCFQLSLDFQSKRIEELSKFLYIIKLDQVNVIGMDSDFKMPYFLRVLDTFIVAHNPNCQLHGKNSNNFQNIVDDSRYQSQTFNNHEFSTLNQKIVKIHISFTDEKFTIN
eukprot:403335969